MSNPDPNIIATGDLVRVCRVIGPAMLVTAITDMGVSTIWFNRRLELQRGVFEPKELFKCVPRERNRDAPPPAGEDA